MYKPVVLVILDGWGLSENKKGNVLFSAQLPTIEKLNNFYPHVSLQASGISVGLPWGEPGNSEVGHLSLGAGKVIYQNMPRITMAIQNGEFFKNPVFLNAIDNTRKNNSALHIMGLVGKGGIHSTIDHLYALLELARDQKVQDLYLHVFTDGRDSSPTSGVESIADLKKRMSQYGTGKIATIGGRYFGMDRNNNWDRIKKSYASMVSGEGIRITDPEQYLRDSYKKEIFDEYIEPAVVYEGDRPVALIKENDSVIFFNFREDRARQITQSFVLPGFSKFERKEIKNLFFATMIQYEDDLPTEVAYPPIEITNCLGEVLSKNKLSQLRISETEKFAHVTYFFNGGNEEPFAKEDRVIIPSTDVASFDQAPEMKAREITDKIVGFVNKEKYDFILVNYANADIVGHTGNEKASIKAVETVDACLNDLIKTILLKKGCLLVTSDHGNVEEIINSHTGETDTEHSTNPVPLWFITPDNHFDQPIKKDNKIAGLLSDIAPTILSLFEIAKPKDMTGESLLDMLK